MIPVRTSTSMSGTNRRASSEHLSWSFVTLIAALIYVLCATGAHAETASAPFVKTVIVGDDPAQTSRQFFGQVSARETVDISFEVGGYLELLDAVEGARIERGELLARLEQGPFERAVARARLALARSERDLERASSLAERNVASQVAAEDARTARDLAQVDLAEAQDELGDSAIVAPFDGLVARRLASPYTVIEPGQPILRLHDMSETHVKIDLPERLLRQIGDPQRAVFTTPASGSETPVVLRLVEFATESNRIGQSYSVTLAFPPDCEVPLLPGNTVTVTTSVAADAVGIEVPASALLVGADRAASVLALRDGPEGAPVLNRVPVEVYSTDGASLRVNGLAPGTEIVVVGAHLLRDGMRVRRYSGLTFEEN